MESLGSHPGMGGDSGDAGASASTAAAAEQQAHSTPLPYIDRPLATVSTPLAPLVDLIDLEPSLALDVAPSAPALQSLGSLASVRLAPSRLRASTLSDSGPPSCLTTGGDGAGGDARNGLEPLASLRLVERAASSSDLRRLPSAGGSSARGGGGGGDTIALPSSGTLTPEAAAAVVEQLGLAPSPRSSVGPAMGAAALGRTPSQIGAGTPSGGVATPSSGSLMFSRPFAEGSFGGNSPFPQPPGPTPGGAAAAATPGGAAGPGGTPTLAQGGGARAHSLTLGASATLMPDVQSFWDYLLAEANPREKVPTTDVVWRQTERDRVYNFLMYVPVQLERLMWIGTLLCATSFLACLTVLPLRCIRALAHVASSRGRPAAGCRLLPGHQLYDVVASALLVLAAGVLTLLRPGHIYYWMKDITSEFLKIHVLFNALEILDKILSNFGVDVLEALSGTCTLYSRRRIGAAQLAADASVAFLLVTAHAAVLMCQAILFSVAMNSARHALLALLIAANFVELKGQVYKRTDTSKLWALACMDIVERFHLLVVLSFVVAEDVTNSGGWLPAPVTLLECARIFGWEVVIDITKHAVLGKFNDIRPGIYREYTRDLCQDALSGQSHSVHKLIGFFPFGPAALALRMALSLFWLRPDSAVGPLGRAAAAALVWAVLCVLQPLVGYASKLVAMAYLLRHNAAAGGKPGPRVIQPKDLGGGGGGAVAGASPAAAAAAGAGGQGSKGLPASGTGSGTAATPAGGPFAAAMQQQQQNGASTRPKAE